jgi:AcrR family transcriptional regulator
MVPDSSDRFLFPSPIDFSSLYDISAEPAPPILSRIALIVFYFLLPLIFSSLYDIIKCADREKEMTGLSNLTEKAIKASALKLLNEKPLNQITIKDITEDCGINRNSFYYHFRDLPSLIETMVLEQAEEIIAEYPSITSLEQCLDAALSFAKNNRRAVMHIYNSVSRDIYEQYLWRVCEQLVASYVNNVIQADAIDSFDREVIINFYKCACFGYMLDWQRGGMKSDLKAQFMRMLEIKKDVIGEIAKEWTGLS